MGKKIKPFTAACANCGKTVIVKTKARGAVAYKSYEQYKATGRVYCCKRCCELYKRMLISKKMSTKSIKRKKQLSEWMKKNNPMKNKSSRDKLSRTLKRIGHKPTPIGAEISKPQQKLFDALGRGWVLEHVVTTNMPRGSGYPTNYKIDIAHPVLKIAIEVDGATHFGEAARKRDRRKEAFLQSRKWKVIRFTNAEILDNVNNCVNKIKVLYGA